MATLSTTKSYSDGSVLFASDLDAFLDDIEAFFNSTKIDDSNIQANQITGSLVLADSSVTTGKITADAITTAKIADAAVTTIKVADDAVTTDKIADEAVTEGKILASNITTAKVLAASVTKPKLSDLNYALGNSSGVVTATSETTVSTVTFTTTSRPVQIVLISDASAVSATLGSWIGWPSYASGTTAHEVGCWIYIYRNSTLLSKQQIAIDATYARQYTAYKLPPSIVSHIDTTASSNTTYSYTVKIAPMTAVPFLSNTVQVGAAYCKILVREL